ncbi:sensor histidine kinase [Rubrivivax sp. RP6-9]|uniref:sensor histidine kinase n=1 Tax=Rubrivivax sp. RP6-9 TaxID=3415750 RepID=UPI003CC51548
MTVPAASPWADRWQRLSASALRAFHAYANWLVGISWKRFIVLSVLLLVASSILQQLPPFRWSVTETIEDASGKDQPAPPKPPKPPRSTDLPRPPAPPASAGDGMDINIQIDEKGIRITPRSKAASAAAAPASAAASDASAAEDSLHIQLPADIDPADVREAVQGAREAILEAIQDQKQAAQDAAEAAREVAQAAREAADDAVVIPGPVGKIRRVRQVHWGDFLTDLALLWIIASAIVKATYKGRIQAEVKAAQAAETAEAESLKRQVVEARMAAMQAQVEPHFLFNTLASIDHLIEVDPPRASQMQKNLIALLRASMPTMREANGAGSSGVRDLGRELAVIRPYLEILKVRMEERLRTAIEVPDGLLSAEFPPMMIQTLVENAIKHGLEPKPEGGSLTVRAEIVHGKLQVSVADTGLGFGKAATAGTGVGLANIRERLQLLYGSKATLTVTENPNGGGTIVTVTVPYKTIEGMATA